MEHTDEHTLIREMILGGQIACIVNPGAARAFFLSRLPSETTESLRIAAFNGTVKGWLSGMLYWIALTGAIFIIAFKVALPDSIFAIGSALLVAALHDRYARQPFAGLWSALLVVGASIGLFIPVAPLAIRSAVCLFVVSLYLQRTCYYSAEQDARLLTLQHPEFLRIAELQGIVFLHPTCEAAFNLLFVPGSDAPQYNIRHRGIVAGLVKQGAAELKCKCGTWAKGDRCSNCGNPTMTPANLEAPYRFTQDDPE